MVEKMNKLIIASETIIVENEDILIEEITKDVNLYLKGKVNCGIKKINKKGTINVYLEKESDSLIEFFLKLENNQNKIYFHNEENTKLNVHFSATFSGENHLEIKNELKHSNIKNDLKIRLVEKEGTINVLAVGDIKEKTKEINYLEDIKALTTNNERIKIMPDLLVKSKEVIANHNTTISDISKKELFYLKSKGLSEAKATEMIKKGFLKGILKNKELGGEENES